MMRKGPGAILLALTLLAGFEAGILAERHWLGAGNEGSRADRPFKPPMAPEAGRGAARFAARLSSRLSLTVQQQQAVEAILTKHNAEVARLLEGLRPEVSARFVLVTEDIRGLLDGDQQKALAAMLEDDQHRFRQRMESGLVGRGPSAWGRPERE